MDKYRVNLTGEERAELEELLGKGKAAARKLAHARVLLLADDSRGDPRPDAEIVSALSLGERTISRVRKRFVTEGFAAALDHKPQPPRPDKIEIKKYDAELVPKACGTVNLRFQDFVEMARIE